MFSKPRNKRSSLKQPSSTIDLTKDRSPVTTTTLVNSTSIQPTTQSIYFRIQKNQNLFFLIQLFRIIKY
jgi:hypothetical protein